MKYVAQFDSKKFFVSCGFVLARLKIIFPLGQKGWSQAGRKGSSLGGVLPVTRCAEVAGCPPRQCGGGAEGGAREEPEMSPEGAVLPLRLDAHWRQFHVACDLGL